VICSQVFWKKVRDLRLRLDEREQSASGLTLVTASIHGNKQTEAFLQKKIVFVGVNAYIPNKWI